MGVSRFGCLYRTENPKKRVAPPTKITKLLIAIDSIVVNPNKAMQIGMMRPPPPIPPLFASPSSTGKNRIP